MEHDFNASWCEDKPVDFFEYFLVSLSWKRPKSMPWGPSSKPVPFYFIYLSLNAKHTTSHMNEMKYYQAAEIVLQLYMSLKVLKYHLNLPKNWILRVKKMLHNIYAA